MGPGVGVFTAGKALHSVKATGERGVRFAYVLAADAFEEARDGKHDEKSSKLHRKAHYFTTSFRCPPAREDKGPRKC